MLIFRAARGAASFASAHQPVIFHKKETLRFHIQLDNIELWEFQLATRVLPNIGFPP